MGGKINDDKIIFNILTTSSLSSFSFSGDGIRRCCTACDGDEKNWKGEEIGWNGSRVESVGVPSDSFSVQASLVGDGSGEESESSDKESQLASDNTFHARDGSSCAVDCFGMGPEGTLKDISWTGWDNYAGNQKESSASCAALNASES